MKKEENQKSSNDNNCGVVSVVLGILSIILLAGNGIGIIIGIIGLIFGKKQEKTSKNKWSRAGITLNIIGIILGIILLIVFIYLVLNNPELMAQIQGQLANAK